MASGFKSKLQRYCKELVGEFEEDVIQTAWRSGPGQQESGINLAAVSRASWVAASGNKLQQEPLLQLLCEDACNSNPSKSKPKRKKSKKKKSQQSKKTKTKTAKAKGKSEL